MFGKSKAVGEDRRVQPMQRSAVTRPAATLHPSETTSSISSEMTVVGKIICKGVLKIYGLVEGELNVSSAVIADGAQIQGDIVAEELTIGGRVKGNILALRVKLLGTAVVEGDIFHRSLSIDENAWFQGCSRSEDNPPEPRSSIKVGSSNPQLRPETLIAFDDKGEFKAESNEEEPNQPGESGMRVFLAACIAIIAIGVMSHFALTALQQPTGLAYTTDGVRIDPSWITRSTQLGRTKPLENTAVRPSVPETPQAALVAQIAPEPIAPKAPAAPYLDPEQVQQIAQSLAAMQQTVQQVAQSLITLRQTVGQLAAGQDQMAREIARLQAADLEILAKIPASLPRPTAALAHKPMPAPPSARAPVAPPSSRAPIPPY
jgi:cytoskeletal protein CcmA (bactofilin family)